MITFFISLIGVAVVMCLFAYGMTIKDKINVLENSEARAKERASFRRRMYLKEQERANDLSRKYITLKDDVHDFVRVLSERKPIEYDDYKALSAECNCEFCNELFKDYLDKSEGLTTAMDIIDEDEY